MFVLGKNPQTKYLTKKIFKLTLFIELNPKRS